MEDTTLYNIYSDKPFTSTIYNVYLRAFQSGLKLSSYFDFSTDCVSSMQALLDDIFYFHQNITNPTVTKNGIAFNITNFLGKNFADSLYKCYLFQTSVNTFLKARFARFLNFEDVFFSFTFNMLAQSLSIKTYSE